MQLWNVPNALSPLAGSFHEVSTRMVLSFEHPPNVYVRFVSEPGLNPRRSSVSSAVQLLNSC